MTHNSKKRLVDQINAYRKDMEEAMDAKEKLTDADVVLLSQALDELIVQYYQSNQVFSPLNENE